METPAVVENIWRQIARQTVVQVDAELESDGALVTVHLADDNAIGVFVHLPLQVRTERGARTFADWIHMGLIADTFGEPE